MLTQTRLLYGAPPLWQVMWPDFIDSVTASDEADVLMEAIVVD